MANTAVLYRRNMEKRFGKYFALNRLTSRTLLLFGLSK